MPETPEQKARVEIDADLVAAGWIVQGKEDLDLTAGRGIAVREFQMKAGFGFADYLLSAFDTAKPWQGAPPDVVYNAGIPPEFFDFIIVDECHRSIYELWSQVLLYFDALPELAAS